MLRGLKVLVASCFFRNKSLKMSKTSSCLDIDGGVMEGGGQILRMSTVFSVLLQKPIRVFNIRAKRNQPGLRPQHLAGLQLIQDLCNGKLLGGAVGSTEITFHPGEIQGGKFLADPHTAGSVTLLFQVAFPCLLFAPGLTELRLKGGTDVDFAPPIDHTMNVFQPVVQKFGAEFDCIVKKRGYFPKGGGEVRIEVKPVNGYLKPIQMTERDDVTSITGKSFVAGQLPTKLADIMKNQSFQMLKAKYPQVKLEIDVVREQPHLAIGTGNGIMLCAKTTKGYVFGSSALGSRSKKPDVVAESAAKSLIDDIDNLACVDKYLQDQLIIFMVLAKGTSNVLCGELTLHTETAIHIAEIFTEVKFNVKKNEIGGNCIIECQGIGFKTGQ